MRRVGWLFAFVVAATVVAAVVSLVGPATRPVPPQKVEGRRQKAEGRRQKAEGRPSATTAATGPVRPAPIGRTASRLRARPMPAALVNVPAALIHVEPPAPAAPTASDDPPIVSAPLLPAARHATLSSAIVDAGSPGPFGRFRLPTRPPQGPGRPLDGARDRPVALLPMYGAFATLQTLDYHSTRRALSSGAGREANPVARTIVKNRPAFIAAKAAATAGMVLATEKMWKTHRVRAIVFMGVANAAMAAVVAHNYSVK